MIDSEKIDIVLPWVDENDAVWNESRKFWQGKLNVNSVMNNDSRFRDYGTLKFVFRSIEAYCPWIRKVFFITANKPPVWLNVDSAKIEIVNHSDFIPHQFLPTFNSSVIMTNIYKIKGLNSKVIVLNDDFFFNKPMKPQDFFKGKLPKDSCEFDPIHPSGDQFSHILLNNLEIVSKYFTKHQITKGNFLKYYSLNLGLKAVIKNLLLSPYKDLLGFKNFHVPTPYIKESMQELANLEKDAFSQNNSKFRDPSDISEWVFRYWRLCKGEFVPTNIDKQGIFFRLNEVNAIIEELNQGKHSMICINDAAELRDSEYGQITQKIEKTFRRKFTNKSAFEL